MNFMNILLVILIIIVLYLLFRPNTSENFVSVPEGSYKKSCKDIKLSGNSVRAKCKNNLGWYGSEQGRSAWCYDMENRDGSLFCKHPM